MKKIIFIFLSLLLISEVFAQSQKVYVAEIEGDIDLGLAPYVRRVVEEAEKNLAEAIIFRINTFGGRVDAATQIKDAILNSKVMTIAFIDKRAISAGALIALSCEKIVMVPGASIGASTVVDQAGQKVSEKYQSYMRSEMRATAEKNGRRTDIAEGMVDERVVVEGLVDSTQLITLTSAEALEYGMTDTIKTNLNDALSMFNLQSADLVHIKIGWAEKIVRFLNNPIISSLLIMVGLVGMFTEIKTPGWGLPGTAALIALALFFGTNFILELASIIEILLFVGGVVLILLELFVVPGFGIVGILGILLIVGSLFLGLISDLPYVDWDMISQAIIQLAGAFIASGIMIYILSKILPKTSIWNTLVLQDNIIGTSGYTTSTPNFSHLLGMTGTAYTDLRPSGTAVIENKRYDVVSDSEFVQNGAKLVVKKVEGSKVVVEEVVDTSADK
ncbi:MAG: nodulation protein NfeD [Melioribacteraceae bacterium]|nr:nodulation protein NfeD [Melioribacteraceae bacterium]MCF8353053.1 nodulation protein NfeD [Melioribacteraceae bacterium]MCF8392944.1 nodulation protein NfeD [Melioribacteraceae bacterium]MCF8417761.1 nodulation protein NfeD [Melioribacteraceae bacterium]